MAVSGSISIKQNSQNIANNTSSITVTGTATMSGPSYDYYTRTGTLTIDGKDYSFSATFPENTTKTLFSKTVTVTHNSVGEKTVSASFSIKTGMTGTLPNGVISKSTSKKLTKIPRTSKVSMSSTNFYIGSTITINTNRASSSFTHTAVIKFNGTTVRTQTNIGASYSWNTSELYAKIPNANRGTGTVTLTTYSGNTNIGSSSVNFTANVRNSNPTFSNFDVEDTNATVLALTGDSTKYVKKYSNAKVTITSANKMTTKNSATAKSYNVVAGSASKSLDYSSSSTVTTTINNVNSNTISVYAIDSRNNQTSVTKSLDVIDYTEVLLQSIDVHRENGIGTSVIITANGKYDNVDFGDVTNSIKTIQFRKKQSSSSTWGSWQSIKYLFDIDTTNGTFETKETLSSSSISGFSLGVEYDVQIKVTDELSEDVEEIQVNSGKVLMSAVKDQGVCFGGIYDTTLGGHLQVGESDPMDIEAEILSLIKQINVQRVTTANTNLNNYTETGMYYFSSTYTPTNIPVGVNGWLRVMSNDENTVKQIWYRYGTADKNDYQIYVRTKFSEGWSTWRRLQIGDIVLYENNSGSTGTITLSDTSDNYYYLEIFYKNNDGFYSSTKVPNPNGKDVVLLTSNPSNSSGRAYFKSTKLSISGTKITPESYSEIRLDDDSVTVDTSTNMISIVKVLGWK